ncbi:MAG TPA: hypothetical protein VGJ78_26415 [Vicinamibacterales bacterium]
MSVRLSNVFHDRFLIVDRTDYYHFGASIKDLGKRGFMFSKIEEPAIISALSAQTSSVWQLRAQFQPVRAWHQHRSGACRARTSRQRKASEVEAL